MVVGVHCHPCAQPRDKEEKQQVVSSKRYVPSDTTNNKKLSADFSLIQASDWLGVATWQFEAAVRRELIPSADRCGHWSATVLEAAAERLVEILAQVGDHPPIGANRAAQRLGHRLDLDIDRVDVEALVERNLLAIAGCYQSWPLYDVRDLDRFADERGDVLTGIVADRQAWQAVSVGPRAASAQLEWRCDEFERVVAERGVRPGRFGRFARTDIEDLAADNDLRAQVLADRLLSPDQACEYLEIRRTDFDSLGLAGLIASTTTRWMRVDRYKKATVPLYRTGELDDLRNVPGLDWEAIRRGEKDEPSQLRDLVTGRPTRAQIIRRFVAELGDRLGVEVWAYHNAATDQCEIGWEELEPGTPSKARILEAITIDRAVAQFCADIVLSTEAGATIRWARDMLEPGVACLLDTETVDLQASVCEIAVIDVATGDTLLNSLVNPGTPISQSAFRTHGISDADVATAPIWLDVLPELLHITEKRKILAYNADYDFHIIRAECRRYGLPPGRLGDRSHWDCVMNRRSNWLRIRRWMPLDGGHRALDDCLNALDVLRSLTAPPVLRPPP